jgi:hypothetical protein
LVIGKGSAFPIPKELNVLGLWINESLANN